MRKALFVFGSVLLFVAWGHAAIEKLYPREDSPHYLYLPQKIDPAKKYWVVVGVHGAGGNSKGANGMAKWVDQKDDVIVIGPKFGKTYQNANPPDQKIVIDLFEQLQEDFNVHTQMFIYGYSGGSQFAHRFVMKRPEYVCGVSAHSGGSWSTDTYGDISDDAKHIPFAISCGANDTGKAWGEAPYGRLEWYKRFEKAMEKEEFFYKGKIWADAGHGGSSGRWPMTEECFQLATTGMLQDSELAKNLVKLQQLAGAGDFDAAQKLKSTISAGSVALPESSGWHDSEESLVARKGLVKEALAEIDTSPAARQRYGLYQKCVQLLKSGKNPGDEAMLSFMRQCPPSFWKGKPDSKLVYDACNQAAAAQLKSMRDKKLLTMQVYQNLIPMWDGLDVGSELLKEYDASAQKELDKVLAMREGTFKKRALQAFVRQWKLGPAVNRATAALSK